VSHLIILFLDFIKGFIVHGDGFLLYRDEEESKWLLMQIKGFERCLGHVWGKGVFGACPKHRFLLLKFSSIHKIEQGDKHQLC
jgi:hypothetical protein